MSLTARTRKTTHEEEVRIPTPEGSPGTGTEDAGKVLFARRPPGPYHRTTESEPLPWVFGDTPNSLCQNLNRKLENT